MLLSTLIPAALGSGVCDSSSLSSQDCKELGCTWANNKCSQPASCEINPSSDEGKFWLTSTLRSSKSNGGIIAERLPITADTARLCSEHPECSAIYNVHLNTRYPTDDLCNSKGALPSQGRDVTRCHKDFPKLYPNKMQDNTYEPFSNDEAKRSYANVRRALPAIVFGNSQCTKNKYCSYPAGFTQDTIVENKAICFKVHGVGDGWIDFAAESEGTNAFCIERWMSSDNSPSPICDATGGLTMCADGGNLRVGQGVTDSVYFKLYANDNKDDANAKVYWRFASSHIASTDPSSIADKEAEDWCEHRAAGDSPFTLLEAYPNAEFGGPVFQRAQSTAATSHTPSVMVVCLTFVLVVFSFVV